MVISPDSLESKERTFYVDDHIQLRHVRQTWLVFRYATVASLAVLSLNEKTIFKKKNCGAS